MEDLNKIILTYRNAGTLCENPWFYEGMTMAEYLEEEELYIDHYIKYGSDEGYVPRWKKNIE